MATPPQEITKGANLLVANDERGATVQFDAAIQKSPKDPNVYIAIAQVCSSLRQWKMAGKYAEQGIAATKDLPNEVRISLYKLAAYAFQYQGMNDKAVAINEEAIKVAPNDPIILNNLGYSYAEAARENDPKEVGRLDQAFKLTTRAVTMARDGGMEPVNIGVFLDSVGWVQYKQGNYDDSVKNLTRAISLAPNEAEIHYHLARAYQKKERNKEAVSELQRALRLDPLLEPAASTLKEIQPLLPSSPKSDKKEQKPSSNTSSHPPGFPQQQRR